MKIRRISVCLFTLITALFLTCITAYADCSFEMQAENGCGINEEITVKLVLSSDEPLADSDVYLVFDEKYFEFVSSDDGEYNASKNAINFRGDFSTDSDSNEWSATFKAKKSGTAEFSLSDKWVKSKNGSVIIADANTLSITIGTSTKTSNSEADEDSPTTSESIISVKQEFDFHIASPTEIPSFFSETSADINGSTIKAWKIDTDKIKASESFAKTEGFYILYGYETDADSSGWYMYDTQTKGLERLMLLDNVDDIEMVKATEEAKSDSNKEAGPAVFDKLLKIIIAVFIVLVIVIILVNIIFGRIEKKSRIKRIQERQRLDREELAQKRAIERKIAEKKKQEEISKNNIQGPGL